MTAPSSSPSSPSSSERRIDTKFYWWLGHVIDILHMPFVIVLVLVGAATFSSEL